MLKTVITIASMPHSLYFHFLFGDDISHGHSNTLADLYTLQRLAISISMTP